MTELLLSTKLYIPPPRANLVVRPRLIQQLMDGLDGKLTLVSAPAGFGKSTLLSAWAAHSKIPAAWLSLDEQDNDPVRFLSYLNAALNRIEPGFSDSLQAASQGISSLGREAAMAAFINEIAGLSKTEGGGTRSEFSLILDDYHEIDNQAIHHALGFVLDHLPPNMHLVISTRTDPPLPLARLRARGELCEIRQADLKFTPAEAAEFLNQSMGLGLTNSDTDNLTQRTEGWIAGLQMAAISMRGHQDLSGFVKAFTGSNRYILDYLVEEVFSLQSPSIQEFLLQTSILERMCAPLCDAILGEKWIREAEIEASGSAAIMGSDAHNSSQLILEYLDNANLFLLPQDDQREWYRYHHLFAQFLQGRLQQTSSIDLSELHRRAANWFEEKGHTSEAISHAIQAHDFDHAVEIIDEYADYFLMSSQITILLGWLRSLPEDLLCSRALLRFTYAWTLLLSGYPLEVVQKYLVEDECGDEDQMSGRALVLRAFIASMQGDTQRAAELSHIVARDLSEDDSFLQSINAWNIGISKLWGGDILAGLKALQKAERIASESGNLMVAVVSLSHQAEIMMLLGELSEAESLFQRALELAVDHQGNPIPIAGTAWVGMGELQREYNQLENARKSLEKGIALAQKWGQIGTLDGYISLARLKQSLGDWKGAQREFDSANQIAEKFDTTELDDVLVAAYQARLWVARADFQRVQEWVEARGLNKEDLGDLQVQMDRGDFSNNYLETLDYITLARLMIAREQFEQAGSLLEKLIAILERKGLHGLAFECQALMAVVLHSLGDEDHALQVLGNVLRLAGPQGYARLFLDLGAPMAGLLYQFIRRRTEDTPERRYAQKLLRAFEVGERGQELGEKTELLIEPLSDREFEVLQLVAEGLSNQQIGERLVVALSTVKTHLNNIYKKLGVSKRTQAVARARELELL